MIMIYPDVLQYHTVSQLMDKHTGYWWNGNSWTYWGDVSL